MNASVDVGLDPLLGACLPPSQLLLEVLRRPLEFTQYTSLAFGKRCREAGVVQSMGSVGDAYDNAMCRELLRDARVRAPRPAELPDRGRGAARSLQLRRGLLQHPPAPLDARLHLARELRETQPCGLKPACGTGTAEALRSARRARGARRFSPPLEGGGEIKSDTINPNNQPSVKAGQVHCLAVEWNGYGLPISHAGPGRVTGTDKRVKHRLRASWLGARTSRTGYRGTRLQTPWSRQGPRSRLSS